MNDDTENINLIEKINEQFNLKLEEFKNNNFRLLNNEEYFEIGYPLNKLSDSEIPFKPIILLQSTLRKSIGLDEKKKDQAHQLTVDKFINFPSFINNPIIVIKGSIDDSKVLLTEIKDKSNFTAIAALHLKSELNYIKIINIASVHSRPDEQLINMLISAISRNEIYYCDKDKIKSWLKQVRQLQLLPKILNQLSDTNIQHSNIQSQVKSEKSFSLNAYEALSFIVTVINGYNADGQALDFSGFKPTYKELPNYDHLIESGDGTYNLTGKGFDETLKNLPQVVLKYKHQTSKLSKHLYSSDYKQACFNIWHFLTKNIKYKMDAAGYEEMRSPARSWKEKNIGIDCDCFSIFSACLLIEMGYNPHFQIVAFNNKPDYGHIYVILKDILLDCVMKKFNQEPDNVTKKLDLMIQNAILNGPDSGIVQTLLNEEKRFKEIINSGNASAADFKELKKIKFLILCANHEALHHLIELMHYVDDINADGNFIYKNPAINSILSHCDGLGAVNYSSLGELEVSEDDISELEDIAGILEEIEEIDNTSLEGLDELSKKQAPKKAARKEKRAVKKAAKKAAPKSKLKVVARKLAPKNVLKTVKKIAVKAAKLTPQYLVAKAIKKKITARKAAPKKTSKKVTPVIPDENYNQDENTNTDENNTETPVDENNPIAPVDENNTEAPVDENNTEAPIDENNSNTDQEQTEQELEGIDRAFVSKLQAEELRLQNKIKSGAYRPNDIKDLKKTRMLIMAQPDERPHLAELMNYVNDIDHNGNYIFNNPVINSIMGHVDGLGNASASIGEIDVSDHDIGEIESIEQICDEMDQINAITFNGLGKIKALGLASKASRKQKRADKKAAGKTIKQKLKNSKVFKKITKVVRKVRKYNPAFAIPRAMFLVIVNENVFNLAYKLSFGYMTQEEAQKEGCDLEEWKKAVDVKNKTEKLFEKVGGSLAKLKQSVDKGKARKEKRVERRANRKGIKGYDLEGLFALGVADGGVTEAAGASAGIWGTILAWFKKVDWKKMGKKAIDKLKGSKTDSENLDENKDIIDNATNPDTSKTGSGGNSLMWILGGLGLVGVAVFAFSGKKNK